jgi:hypothetical protein
MTTGLVGKSFGASRGGVVMLELLQVTLHIANMFVSTGEDDST